MISAAPNRSRIRATCEATVQSADSPRKWSLRLHIDSVDVLRGGHFINVGDHVDSIAFDLPSVPQPGAVITAEAEYLGGPRGGILQLHDVRVD